MSKSLEVLAIVIALGVAATFCSTISVQNTGKATEYVWAASIGGSYVKDPLMDFYVYAMNQPSPELGNTLNVVAYDKSCMQKAIISFTGTGARGTVFISQLRFAVIPELQSVQVFDAQISGSSLSFVRVPSMTSTASHQLFKYGLSEPNTNYIYVGYLNYYFVCHGKIDVSAMTISNLNMQSSCTYIMTDHYVRLWITDDVFMTVLAGGFMLVNKLNVSYQGAYASNFITMQAIRQSPTSPNYFFISDDTSVYDSTGISRYRAPLDGSGVTHTGYKTTAELVSKMVKSEVYSIIYAGQITSNDFYLIDMHSLDEIVKLQLPGRPLSFTPVIGFVGKLTEDIGFVNAVSKGFEVWKLTGDFCLITAQNPCQQCVNGRFLDSLNTPDNKCIKPEDFPIGYGPNGLSMSPCLGDINLSCIKCETVYSTCTACNIAAGFYLYQTTNLCYLVANMPIGVGLDAQNKVAVPCEDSNCEDCKQNFKVCESCKPLHYVKYGTTKPCYQNNLPGFGIKTTAPSTLTIAACTTQNCINCFTSYLVCEGCRANYYRQFDGTPGCFVNNVTRKGLRGTGPEKFINDCFNPRCTNCLNDYQVCVKCENNYIVSSGSCLSFSTIGEGVDPSNTAGPLVLCKTASCYICILNYYNCQQCIDNYYFLYESTSSCVQNNIAGRGLYQMPDGTSRLGQCLVNQCNKCFQSSDTCEECSAGYYTKVNDQTICIANTVNKKGLDLTTTPARIDDCDDNSCLDCRADIDACIQCEYPQFAVASVCDYFSDKFGQNLAGVQAACSVSNCAICWTSLAVCDRCMPGFYPLKSQPTTTCIANDQQGVGVTQVYRAGPGTPGMIAMLEPCQDFKCKSCSQDITKCQDCVDNYYLREGTTSGCQLVNASPSRGIKLINDKPFIAGCLDKGCLNCFQNYSICNQCKTNKYLKQGVPEGAFLSCFSNNIANFGVMSKDSKMIGPCLVEECTKCLSNSSKCETCKSTYYPVDVVKNLCVKQDSTGYVIINAGSSTVMRPCVSQGCKLCPGSGQYCDICLSPLLLTQINTCVTNDKPGFGEDKGDYRQCATDNCINCFIDYKDCKKCRPGTIINKSGQCIKTTKFLKIVNKPILNSQTRSFDITFSDRIIDQANFLEQLRMIVVLVNGDILSSDKYSIELKTTGDATVQGSLKLSTDIDIRDLKYLKMSSVNPEEPIFYNDDSQYPPDQNIEVEVYQVVNSQVTQGSQATVAAAVSSVIVGSSVVSGTSGTGGSRMSGLIKIIDLVEYYLYMDGERVVKADQFLHLFKTNMLEILPNVFMADEDRLNCSPQHNFKREDLSCFFLNNFGSEIFTLIILIILAVLFHMMKRKTTKFIKNNRIKPWKMKLLQIFCIWPSSMINMSFLIGLIDGSQIELFRQTFLNIGADTSNGLITFGRILSIACLLVFGSLAYYYVKFARLYMLSQNPIVINAAEPEINLGYVILKEIFEGIRSGEPNRFNIHVYLPLINILYCFAGQLMLVALAGTGPSQIWLILAVDLVYLSFLLWVRPYKHRWRNVVVAAMIGCICLIDIISLNIVYSSTYSVRKREPALAVALIFLFVLAILLASVPLFAQVFTASKQIVSKVNIRNAMRRFSNQVLSKSTTAEALSLPRGDSIGKVSPLRKINRLSSAGKHLDSGLLTFKALEEERQVLHDRQQALSERNSLQGLFEENGKDVENGKIRLNHIARSLEQVLNPISNKASSIVKKITHTYAGLPGKLTGSQKMIKTQRSGSIFLPNKPSNNRKVQTGIRNSISTLPIQEAKISIPANP